MGIRVMDTSAFVLAGEQHLTMHVFDVGEGQLMKRICQGENIGHPDHQLTPSSRSTSSADSRRVFPACE